MGSVSLSSGRTVHVMQRLFISLALVVLVCHEASCANVPPTPSRATTLGVNLYWDSAVQRTRRIEKVCVRLENPTDANIVTDVEIVMPKGLQLKSAAKQQVRSWTRNYVFTPMHSPQPYSLEKLKNATLTWEVEASEPFDGVLKVIVSADGIATSTKSLRARFTKPVEMTKAEYVPRPIPANTDYLIGAHYFPGWKPGAHTGWSVISPYPERKPALGWYDESNPEVTDWEIKWALEHGINFFVYCWYRQNSSEGGPVTQMLGHAIHNGLFKSRYWPMFKFCIMWENSNAGGISSLDDLKNNLLPYWIENYFNNPGYLKVDNKPVLFVYDFIKFKQKLGGAEQAKKAIRLMKEACVKAGFDGLWVTAEYRGWDPWAMRLITACGFDASFAYCWQNIPQDASDDQAVEVQMKNIREPIKWGYLPNIPTLSMGWNPEPWVTYCGYPKSVSWRLSPKGYETLCRQVKQTMDSLPKKQLGHRMALLDNWNEFGEGHYITPTRQEGFGYLDAVRNVFTNSPRQHVDIVPEDVGLGPYDQSYHEWLKDQQIKVNQLESERTECKESKMKNSYQIGVYYFPNYHVDRRNEELHGVGWTEWELVKNAKPRFPGHQQPKVPVWGYEDEADPLVFAKKIDAAADHGISQFIFDWYWYNDGPFLNKCLDEGYMNAANNSRLKFSLMWANHDRVDIHPAKLHQVPTLLYPGTVTPSTFDAMTDYIVDHYFSHPSYWKIDGCPYFSIYDLTTLVRGLGGLEATKEALSAFRRKTIAAGFPDLHLNGVVWSVHTLPGEAMRSPNAVLTFLGFQSVTSYVWVHHVALRDFPCTSYEFLAAESEKYWDTATKEFELPYFPNVSMGWDSSPRACQSDVYTNSDYPFCPVVINNTPEAFKSSLQHVKAFLNKCEKANGIFTINAWNEWTEGSYLEPDTIYGMQYLQAIKEVFDKQSKSSK